MILLSILYQIEVRQNLCRCVQLDQILLITLLLRGIQK